METQHKQPQSRPVLVVGAGPTGMTAAMELRRMGVPVRIVDRVLTPPTTSRALAVQARTLELFDQRGLSERMLRGGNVAHAATIYGDGRRLGKVDLGVVQSRHNSILMVAQSETEGILREWLADNGVAVEFGTEMVGLSQPEDLDGVRAVLRDSAGRVEEVDASYMVCAEGAHSSIRRTMGLEFKGRTMEQSYLLGDLHLDGELPDDELSIFLSDHGFLAAFPMGNRHFRLAATDPAKHPKDAAAPTLEELQRVYDAVSHIPVRLRDLAWSSRFAINSRVLGTLRVGRVFFGGDAAHIHSPAGGQGMNTGIQDMIDLGWKLAMVIHGQASPSLLDTYEKDRLPVIKSVVANTETATNALNSESPIVHGLISHVLPLALARSFVQKTGAGALSQVVANYRSSPLSSAEDDLGALKAGDRVPDPDVVVGEGEITRTARLYDLLDPNKLTLLGVGERIAPALEESLAPWRPILSLLGVDVGGESPLGAPGLYLVRPDAYLGFTGRHGSTDALLEWLRRWFPPAPGSPETSSMAEAGIGGDLR